MDDRISDLVKGIRESISDGKLDSDSIDNAIRKLTDIGHPAYNSNKFPKLEDTASFSTDIGTTPRTLAEALLWKMGKWPTYLKFSENYRNKSLKVSKDGGVVFSAFAKHLQDNELPIYDQHAIRAIWAIVDPGENEEKFKSLLFDKSERWKPTGSGDDGSCYEIFCESVNYICKKNRISHQQLDFLLMPLGQALKKEAKAKGKGKGNAEPQTDFSIFKKIIALDDSFSQS